MGLVRPLGVPDRGVGQGSPARARSCKAASFGLALSPSVHNHREASFLKIVDLTMYNNAEQNPHLPPHPQVGAHLEQDLQALLATAFPSLPQARISNKICNGLLAAALTKAVAADRSRPGLKQEPDSAAARTAKELHSLGIERDMVTMATEEVVDEEAETRAIEATAEDEDIVEPPPETLEEDHDQNTLWPPQDTVDITLLYGSGFSESVSQSAPAELRESGPPADTERAAVAKFFRLGRAD